MSSEAPAPSKKATEPILYGFPSTDDLSQALANFVLAAQDEALKKQATFKIAISGGSLPKVLGKNLIGRSDVPWDKWCVPLDRFLVRTKRRAGRHGALT